MIVKPLRNTLDESIYLKDIIKGKPKKNLWSKVRNTFHGRHGKYNSKLLRCVPYMKDDKVKVQIFLSYLPHGVEGHNRVWQS